MQKSNTISYCDFNWYNVHPSNQNNTERKTFIRIHQNYHAFSFLICHSPSWFDFNKNCGVTFVYVFSAFFMRASSLKKNVVLNSPNYFKICLKSDSQNIWKNNAF